MFFLCAKDIEEADTMIGLCKRKRQRKRKRKMEKKGEKKGLPASERMWKKGTEKSFKNFAYYGKGYRVEKVK